MDLKKRLVLHFLTHRAFKQRVDSCFHDLSLKEKQRKRCSDYTIHEFLTINPMLTFVHHVSAPYDVNSATVLSIFGSTSCLEPSFWGL